jgi:hypothetical protein
MGPEDFQLDASYGDSIKSIISGVILYSLTLYRNQILDSKEINIIGLTASILGGVIGGLLTF